MADSFRQGALLADLAQRLLGAFRRGRLDEYVQASAPSAILPVEHGQGNQDASAGMRQQTSTAMIGYGICSTPAGGAAFATPSGRQASRPRLPQ